MEGPHLFKKNGWYYLTTAEGGTGYGHAVTMARSREISGPYEMHPDIHLITSKDHPEAALQRAGHGQYVETPDGEVYHTHLCGRPLPSTRRSPLGRETAIQKCVWKEDGWLYLAHGSPVPEVVVPSPEEVEPELATALVRDFDDRQLPAEFQWLRTPEPERLFSLVERSGHLRLYGRESIGSWFEQSLVARRQESHSFRAETIVDFSPDTYQQVAGLTYYYNRHKFHAVGVTLNERLGRVVTILSCPGDYPESRLSFPIGEGETVAAGPVEIAMEVRNQELQFYMRGHSGDAWRPVGPVLDAGVVSDEGGRGEHGSFTGAFAGMFCFDISGRAQPADFDRFAYLPL